MSNSFRVFAQIILFSITTLIGCSGFKKVKRETIPKASFQELSDTQLHNMKLSSPFLKVHMNNGNMYVLQDWSTDPTLQNVVGRGAMFNANRDTLRQGQFQIGLDSVAIFETNSLKTSGTVTALTVFTGITAAVTIACIANPKACFGSCPTFYIQDEDSLRLQAEGFSASIAPSLEATDIDALIHASITGEEFEIEMRNEALETHVVRHVDLLAVPKTKNTHIFADLHGRFWEVNSLFSPISATAPEGDCLELLLNADNKERFSKTDSIYLGTKEIIELKFDNIPDKPCALVIGCRQTLLSTYLLYQTYAYMGNNAGYWFAQIARNKVKQHDNSIQKLLGGIEVLIQDSLGHWIVVDQINEYGPLATDFHVLPFVQLTSESATIRLRMTKGNWRIDYATLAVLSRPVEAFRVRPHLVLKNGQIDNRAHTLLLDSSSVLITLPGDTYKLKYQIPVASGEYDLFIESRGYYLEWIRKEWIEEENPFLLTEMFLNPQAALKRLAPEFKRMEEEMEDHFWRSRYASP